MGNITMKEYRKFILGQDCSIYNSKENWVKVELQRKLQLCTNYILCLC